MGVVEWLNANAGVLTLAFVILTFLTLLEARAARIASSQSAHVSFRPDVDEETGDALFLRLRNFGPAVAEDVKMKLVWKPHPGEEPVTPRKLTEPVLGVDDERVYLPGIILGTGLGGLKKLGDRTLLVEWSWLDERHRFGPWVRLRSRRDLTLELREFRESIAAGPLVLDRQSHSGRLREIARQFKELNERQRQAAMQRSLDDWVPDSQDVRAEFEKMRVLDWARRTMDLWKARLQVWTRPRRR